MAEQKKWNIFIDICVLDINIELNSWVCLWAGLLADITDALLNIKNQCKHIYIELGTAMKQLECLQGWMEMISLPRIRLHFDLISFTIHRSSRRHNHNQFKSAAAVKPRLTGTHLDTPL